MITVYGTAPNKAKAQQLFSQLASEGMTVDFTYITTSAAADVKIAQYIQSRLSTFQNVKMTIQTQSGADRIKNYRTSNFQMTTGTTWFTAPDLLRFAQNLHTGWGKYCSVVGLCVSDDKVKAVAQRDQLIR